MKRAIIALIGLALIGPAFAADDAPMEITSTTLLTQNIPDGYEVTLAITPNVKVDGVNCANSTKIYVEGFKSVRSLVHGVQVGDLKRQSLG